MIIVLVGSPLSGKTTLLKELQKKDIKVFSADSFITKIYKSKQKGYEIIKKELGEKFVNDKQVNKRLLAEWVSIEGNLQILNELIHPIIYEYLNKKDNFVAELPILTNSPIKFNYDKLILVKASSEIITKRFYKAKLTNPNFIKKFL
ncbi:MAG: dephospho-CoA kinase [Mycoplasmataceae bacterium]|nr:dephospho-CoA kinase [Mycoplasmataceae bacterium]